MAPSARLALALACLGGIAILLGSFAVTLQILVIQKRNHINLKKNQGGGTGNNGGSKRDKHKLTSTNDNNNSSIWKTIQPSDPTESNTLWVNSKSSLSYSVSSSDAFWNQVVPWLQQWDATLLKQNDEPSSFTLTSKKDALFALRQAATLGNAQAQYYVATALASGIWPIHDSEQDKSNSNINHNLLHIPDDMIPSSPNETQAMESYILYRMAAMQGHIDASLALGYRILLQYIQNDYIFGAAAAGSSSSGTGDSSSSNRLTNLNLESVPPRICEAALPYYENAVHHIMDQLETSSESRTKVNPPMDHHILSQIHMHGGTSSQLSLQNKPDESPEAIQYYHLRATMKPDPDIHAAYTLAHLYHYGLRGVAQNLTLALQYYEIAAHENHWEAAGQAGKFYFWGLGMPEPSTQRDLLKAKEYFEMGTPFGYEGCQKQWKAQRKLLTNINSSGNKHQKGANAKDNNKDSSSASSSSSSSSSSSTTTNIAQCDHPALNGMGLLHLYGIQDHMPVDIDRARKYFTLAKQAGNMDAAYNLAMMNLGWKTHYQLDPNNDNQEKKETKDDNDNDEESKSKGITHDEDDDDYYDEGDGTSQEKKDLDDHDEPVEDDSEDEFDVEDDKDVDYERQTHSPTTKESMPRGGGNSKPNGTQNKKPVKSTGPNRHAYSGALNDLINAAAKGHLQAKHRLGMMYQYGIDMSLRDQEKPSTTTTVTTAAKIQSKITVNPDGTTTRTTTIESSGTGDGAASLTNEDIRAATAAAAITQMKKVIPQDCNKALGHYRYIVDHASPSLSQRTRKAYKYYMAGDYEKSLRNYLLAAESGSEIGQVNAAFLMERGECLGLTEYNCAKAAVRLYKAAAVLGNAEASLRVGDFYYYGRLRDYSSIRSRATTSQRRKGSSSSSDEDDQSAFLWNQDMAQSSSWFSSFQQHQHGVLTSPGPFGWINYFVYPEKVLLPLFMDCVQIVSQTISGKGTSTAKDDMDDTSSQGNVVDDTEQAENEEESLSSSRQSDLAMAAHFFRQAAERKNNPRANFNLGFMYEWGLGVKQDFPLAKRHYDLAAPSSSNMQEAEVPVQIALTILSFHEKFVKFQMAYNMMDDWSFGFSDGSSDETRTTTTTGKQRKSKMGILLSRLVFSWESLLILILTWVLLKLVVRRRRQQQQ